MGGASSGPQTEQGETAAIKEVKFYNILRDNTGALKTLTSTLEIMRKN